MYTEDDENVEVKEDNSNAKDPDFYTSFNDIEKEEKKPKKGKKKTTKTKKEEVVEVEPNEEEDYQDFYANNEENKEEDNSNRKNILKFIIIGIILLLLIIAIVLFFALRGSKDGIELTKNEITLDMGQKEYISYKVVNPDDKVTSRFASSDESVVTVNDDGEVTAVGYGEATITIYYTINGATKEKKCPVTVNIGNDVDQKISLNLKLTNGNNNTWTNKDVIVTPEAKSVFGVVSIKYAINCDSNCEYNDVTNNKITISKVGTTKVSVIAKDKKNQEITKEVTIKIDKEAPTATLVGDTNIKSTSDVEVCATCTDKLSGCRQAKVCKKFTSSKSNQTIIVTDAAGNTSASKSFNVTINKPAQSLSCSLKVASDGTVTATTKGEPSYYGFNSSYSGSNTKTKKIAISATKKGSYAQVVYYYVKDKNGATSKCFLTVVKKCVCKDNSTSNSCATTCTYSSQ